MTPSHRLPALTGPRPSRSAATFGAALLFASSLLGSPAQAITNDTDSGLFNGVGLGVQVTQDWVFTVRHVAPSVGALLNYGYGVRQVAAVYHAPGSELGFPSDDFSLFRLAPALPLVVVPSMPVQADPLPAGTLLPALPVTIVSASNAVPGPRGYGHTTISEVVTQIDPDDAGPAGLATVNWLLSLDAAVHVQPGDSGGGLFLGHVTDISVLMGLNSALLQQQVNPGNGPPVLQDIGSAFVQPAAYRGWIDSTMASDLSDNQSIQWVSAVSAVPEPATWALWSLGLGLTLLARKRGPGRSGRA